MKWGRKHSTKQKEYSQENHHNNNNNNNNNNNKKQPSTFSLSNILPLSWLSKLKHHHHHPKTNINAAPISKQKCTSTPVPPPPLKPSFSPPPLRSNSDHLVPRRLSLDHSHSHSRANSLPRYRHYSLGSELDLFRSDFHLLDPIRTRTRTRARRRSLKQHRPDPIETDILQHRPRTDPNPDPIRSGRRSFSGRIRPKVRMYSPRLANIHPNPIAKERGGGLERFAVVKKSSDPVRDFRESMVEMIWEKGIGRPEELESLLACYLSLNSDEHHDVIVKVFRQVWFDLNREAGRVRLVIGS